MKLIREIKRCIAKHITKAVYNRKYIKPRYTYASKDIAMKLKCSDIKPIDKTTRKRISEFWKGYPVKIDYRWYDFFNAIDPNTDNLEYYIPHDIYYSIIDAYYSDIRRAMVFDDKNMYDMYFYDIRRPKTILHIMDGKILDEKYQPLTLDSAIAKCKAEKRVIIKPSIDSEGGEGICFWGSNNTESELINILKSSGKNLIVQEIAKQSDALNSLHKESVNTIRVISLIHKGEVKILSAILRMGVNGAQIDNAAAGGLFCGINTNGRLKAVAYDTKGHPHTEHPQGGELTKFVTPSFDECLNLIKYAAPRLSHISKLCSWDLYIDDSDMPRLLEVNLTYGDVQLHQVTNGPIFGDMTPEILNDVFKR